MHEAYGSKKQWRNIKKLFLLATLLCLTNVFADDASNKTVHDSQHTKAAKSAKMTGIAICLHMNKSLKSYAIFSQG